MPPTGKPTGKLNGKLVDAKDGQALAGIHVEARDAEGQIGVQNELPLHSLGQSIAQSAVAVQRELGRCNRGTDSGFIVDELDLTVPVRLRLDPFGQVLASIQDPQPLIPSVGQLRLRIRFATAAEMPTVSCDQTIRETGLSPDDCMKLEKYHLFTVDDLLRIGRTVLGVQALERLGMSKPPAALLGRALLLALGCPSALFDCGIETLDHLLAANASSLAAQLTAKSNRLWKTEEVLEWQSRARKG